MSAKVDVYLVVTSHQLSLSELSARLGRGPQPGSHDKGEPRLKKTSWQTTVWRESPRDRGAEMHVQCSQLLRDMPLACIDLRDANPDDVSVTLDIAVFFHAADLDLILPRALIAELAASGVDLEVTGYPCTSEAEEKPAKR